MKISPVRDSIATALGAAPMAAGLPPLGVIGVAFKKAFISDDTSFGKRFMVGFAAMIASGGAGLIPYLIATPGREAKADVQSAKANAAADHYNS